MALPSNPSSNDKYFATASTEDIGGELFKKVEAFYTWSRSSQVLDRLERAYRYYFGYDYTGMHATSEVTREGDEGELASVRVNHSRALAQTLFNLIAAAKVVWQPVATNSDYASSSQAVLAQNILEYYWQDRRVAQFCQRGLEESIPFTEGFLLTEWDETMGEPVAVDEQGGLVKSGDIRFTNVMTWDAIRDPRKASYEDLDWIILKLRRNKFDLAARYPQYADEILHTAVDYSQYKPRRMYEALPVESDDTDVFYFFHKPSAALKMGRETVFISSKAVLKDGPLTTNTWPVHRVFHSELLGTPWAYSPYHEILGVQELMDSLETSIASNQSTFGTQLIVMEQGSEIDVDFLGGGMKAIYVPPGGKAPEALNLTKSAPEVFAHLKEKKNDIQLLMGLNSVVRGEPQSGDQTGAALALLQAQAVQQSSGLQANYLRFVESVGNAVLELIRTRCPLPRRIAIAGKANQFLQKEQEFTGESIGQIRKVMVEIGNPLQQTPAGRVSIAKELLANQLVKTPEQYLQVIMTGRLEPLTQSVQNELLLVLKENEQILSGEVPVASVDDDHLLHCREHRGSLANPDARKDPRVVAAYMAHIQDHEQLYFTADPRRLMLMGQQPPPMMGPPQPPPGQPGPAPAPPGAPPTGGIPAGPHDAQLPSMPVNPATGDQAATPDGATLSKPGLPPGPKAPPGGITGNNGQA